MSRGIIDSLTPEERIQFGGNTWEPVIGFEDIDTPAIPATFLPGWAGDFVREISACAQTPESFGVVLGFAVIAACTQQRFTVTPYSDAYTEPVNIWGVCVMAPGTRKTFITEQLTAPVVEWELQQARDMKPNIEENEATRAVLTKRIEKLQNEAAKEADSVQRSGLIQDICRLRDSMPEAVMTPRLFTNDCTPERFQSLLVENGERMAVLSDEGGIFEVMSGLYSEGRVNLDVFLKSHSGSPVRVDRNSRDAHLNHPLSTFGLAVQPAVIEDLTQGSKRRFRGTGCLARFLYCIPVSNVGQRDMTERFVISDAVRQRYTDGVLALLNTAPIIQNDVELPRVLRLDPEALQSWIAFQQALENRQGETGDLNTINDWSAKLPGQALRLAALAHIVENGPEHLTISRQTLERSLDLVELLIPHALCAFSLMGADQATSDAKYVARWIQGRGVGLLQQRDIHRGCHGRIPRVDRLQKALAVLVERHMLSEPIVEKTGGRPSIQFMVNPAFIRGQQ